MAKSAMEHEFMKNKLLILLTILFLFISVQAALAESGDDEEKVFAIQNKVFHRFHELAFCVGYIPDDNFYDIYPLGLSYTFNFNEKFSWEVARVQWNFNQEKDIKQQLEDEYGVAPSEFSEMKYMLHSHLVYRPLYGKSALLNKWVFNNETYFLIGGGTVNYEKKFNYGDPETEDALSFSFGIGSKYFLNEYFCLNFEIRDIMNFREEETENIIYFGMSLGFRFDLSARKTKKDTTVEELKQYLKTEKENE